MHTRQIRCASMLMLVLFVGVVTTACNMFMFPLGGGTGSLRLLVTDKPFPYEVIEEATVTVKEIKVRRTNDDDGSLDNDNADNSNATSDSDDDDSDGGFVTIFEGERELNLLELRNGRTDLLSETTIEAGQYDEMRIVVTEGRVKLSDDREFDLRVPSGSSSGIKLKFDFEVETNEETVLLLDIDLSRAFSAIPSGMIDDVSTIREFRFQPSLAMRLIDLLEAGSISGTLQNDNGDPLESVAVTAFDDESNEVTSTSTESDGSFTLFGLPTGQYRVEFTASGFTDAERTDVDVTAENETSLGTIELTADSL